MKSFLSSRTLLLPVIVCLLGLALIAALADEAKVESETVIEASQEVTIRTTEPYYGIDLPTDGRTDCPQLWFDEDPDLYPPVEPPTGGPFSHSENPTQTVIYDARTGEVSIEEVGRESMPLPEEVYNWNPPEGWEPESPEGTDGWAMIPGTTGFPWRSMVKLYITWPDATGGGCSGAIVDGFHVLTAGHCIHNVDKGGWAITVRVIPGYDCGYMPYYQAWQTYIRSYTGWTQDQNPEHDWALVTLDRNIGNFVGWMPRLTTTDLSWYENRILSGAGYPGSMGGECMYYPVLFTYREPFSLPSV